MSASYFVGQNFCEFRLKITLSADYFKETNNSNIYKKIKNGVQRVSLNNSLYLPFIDSSLVSINNTYDFNDQSFFIDVIVNDGVVNCSFVDNPIIGNVSNVDPSYGSQTRARVPLKVSCSLLKYQQNTDIGVNESILKYVGKSFCINIFGVSLIVKSGKISSDNIHIDSENLVNVFCNGFSMFSLTSPSVGSVNFTNNIVYTSLSIYNNLNIESLGFTSIMFDDIVCPECPDCPECPQVPSEIQVLSDIDNSLKQLTSEVIEVGKAVSSFNVDIDVINNDKEKSLVNTVFPYKNFKS